MQCPRCQAELPEAARFCGMCGFKFEVSVVGEKPAKTAREDPADAIRFFQDSTEQTDIKRTQELLKLAEKHMSTPAPAALGGALPEPGRTELMPVSEAAPTVETGEPSLPETVVVSAPAGEAPAAVLPLAEAPRVEAAPARQEPAVSEPPAAKAEPSVDPVTRQPFTFDAADLHKAMQRAAEKEGKGAPEGSSSDVGAYYQLGKDAGIARKTLEEVLHQVALEKMDRRRGDDMFTNAALLTGEFEPIKPSGKKVAAIAGGVVAALVAVVMLISGGGGAEAPKAGEGAAVGGETAPTEGAPADETGKRKPGKLDEAALKAAIEAVGRKAQACHEAALKKNNKLAGRMVLDVEIEEDGKLSKADVKEDSVKDAPMTACVTDAVRTHAWPKPQGGFASFEFPLPFQVTEQAKPAASSKGGKKKGRKR